MEEFSASSSSISSYYDGKTHETPHTAGAGRSVCAWSWFLFFFFFVELSHMVFSDCNTSKNTLFPELEAAFLNSFWSEIIIYVQVVHVTEQIKFFRHSFNSLYLALRVKLYLLYPYSHLHTHIRRCSCFVVAEVAAWTCAASVGNKKQ